MAARTLAPILPRMTTILAHETWFGPDSFPSDWGFATQTLTLVLLAAALAATVAVRVIARYFPGADVSWLGRCAPFMPFAVRIHLAVSLIGLLSLGYYLSPAMDLHANFTGIRTPSRPTGASRPRR
jgi:hypothetical protein